VYVLKLGHQIYKDPYGTYSFPYPIRNGIEGVTSYITNDWHWELLYLKDMAVRSETPLFVYEDIDSAWNELAERSKYSTSIRLWIAETPHVFDAPCRILTDPDFYAKEYWQKWFANQEQPPAYWDTWDYVTVGPPPGCKICYELTLRAKIPTHREIHSIGHAILESTYDDAKRHYEEFLKHQ
jgi:hypothetical protein